MSGTPSPFVSGARVAIVQGYGDRYYTEAFVDRVYKNGNFTLRNPNGAAKNSQQWRPRQRRSFGDDPPRWCANKTGRRDFNRTEVVPWDETSDAEISEAKARQDRRTRWYGLVKRVMSVSHDNVTDAMCDTLERVLSGTLEKALPAAP